jgi:carbon monoxide dehydrogenase subunit G
MEFTGEYPIPAPRELVWRELNDPSVLQSCIPGCEGLDLVGDNRFEARLFAKVGPVQAKFKGTVSLQNLAPPASYDIDFEGSGGVAFADQGDLAMRGEHQVEACACDEDGQGSRGVQQGQGKPGGEGQDLGRGEGVQHGASFSPGPGNLFPQSRLRRRRGPGRGARTPAPSRFRS